MKMNQRSITAALAAAAMLFAANVMAAGPSIGIAPAKLDTWQKVGPSAYEKFNTDGTYERLDITGDVQPDALDYSSGTMCVNTISGPAHNGYFYQFDSDISNGVLGTTATARALVTDVPNGVSSPPTTSVVTSQATVTNGFIPHTTTNTGGFGSIVSAVANFDFSPTPAGCGASTYSKIDLTGSACSTETIVDYSKSSDCTD
jgi:hypothetical protein